MLLGYAPFSGNVGSLGIPKIVGCGDQVRVAPPNQALICPARMVAFVHIFKSAGTSVIQAVKRACPGSVVEYRGYSEDYSDTTGKHPVDSGPRSRNMSFGAAVGEEPRDGSPAAHDLWEDAVRRAFIGDLGSGKLFKLFTYVRGDVPGRFLSAVHEIGLRHGAITHLRGGGRRANQRFSAAVKEAKRDGVHIADAVMRTLAATSSNSSVWPFDQAANAHLTPQWSFLGRLARGSRLHVCPGLQFVVRLGSEDDESAALFRHLFNASLVGSSLGHARTRLGKDNNNFNTLKKSDATADVAHAAAMVAFAHTSVADLSGQTMQAIWRYYGVDMACIEYSLGAWDGTDKLH